MMCDTQTLLSDLDGVLSKVSTSKQQLMLRQVTELFLAHADHYSGAQVAVFDAVIKRLARDIGPRGQAELSRLLASLDGAPADTIGELSNSDDIAVSGPVLEKSTVLKDSDLVGIARAKSQRHLLAIAGRQKINEPVTDVLVERGNPAVKRKVITNHGALISESGFARLISEARTDRDLASMVRGREDIPPELLPFLELALA